MSRYRRAIFKPLVTDDLQNDAELFIGKEITVYYGWIADEGDAYGGQEIYIPLTGTGWFIGWVPACDLEFIGEANEST